MKHQYVHGYSLSENQRLADQAMTLTGIIHHDSNFAPGAQVLEAGCGVGAQTVIVAAQNPDTFFTSIDISPASVEEAARRVDEAKLNNVSLRQGNIFALDFPPDSFDHIFLCFVLEHLPNPVEALSLLMKVLKPGGSIMLIEGDHGSTYFYPDSSAAHAAIDCQVRLQAEAGGNALIGRELYPLLTRAGFQNIHVSPRMVYVDHSRPELVDGFIRKTFTAMIEGVEKDAVGRGLISREDFSKGIHDLYRTAESDGTFCYTFFKAFAVKP